MKCCNNCGKSMEDSAMFCSGCGAKAGTVFEEQTQNSRNEDFSSNGLIFTYNGITVNLQDIIDRNGTKKINAIKELRELTKIDLETGKKVIDEAYLGRLYVPNQKVTIAKNQNISKENKHPLISVLLKLIPIVIVIFLLKTVLDSRTAPATKATTETETTEQTNSTDATASKQVELSESDYKSKCVDIPWEEVVKDRKTYVGAYLKKDLMVRQIGTDSTNDETVYICGEKKDENSYVGGTFTVYDRRSDKTRPIELYDKIYVYGQITGIYMTYSSYNPELEVKYIQFNGKFGQ